MDTHTHTHKESTNLNHTLLRLVAHGQHGDVGASRLFELLQQLGALGVQRVGPHDVDLVGDQVQRLILEQRLDVLEQLHLLRDGVAALLRDVDEVQHAAVQVRQCGDRLHFDCVAVLKRVVEQTWGIDYLCEEGVRAGRGGSKPENNKNA